MLYTTKIKAIQYRDFCCMAICLVYNKSRWHIPPFQMPAAHSQELNQNCADKRGNYIIWSICASQELLDSEGMHPGAA